MNKEITVDLVDHEQNTVYQGQDVDVRATVIECDTKVAWQPPKDSKDYKYEWSALFGHYEARIAPKDSKNPLEARLETEGAEFGTYTVTLRIFQDGKEVGKGVMPDKVQVLPPATLRGSGPVTLGRSSVGETKDVALWQAIRQGSEAISFPNYQTFVDKVMSCGPHSTHLKPEEIEAFKKVGGGRGTLFPGIGKYQLLKAATEVFLMLNCRVLDQYKFTKAEADEYNARNDRKRTSGGLNQMWTQYLAQVNGDGAGTVTLPYLRLIQRKLGEPIIKQDTDACAIEEMEGILQEKLTRPCFFELIWSYWIEEGMLVQTLNTIAVRFQNQRTSVRDPLGNLTIAPLYPINSILFGYIQDEQHRLTVARRAYEYDHEYGFTLHGRAVPALRSADSRSKFIEAFHNLLTACVVFYKQDDNTMMIADGFPVLNALKEVHLLLAEGAHNQFGDLPATARVEMLMQQWILARPEIREFIGGRPMVPYAEAWMDRVDAMKKLQNWTDVTITYFHDLARFGEQLLLSIRYGSWSDLHESRSATNWARDWRAEVKQLIHAYRAVTGVDLNVEAFDPQVSDRYAPPSTHLQRRLELQHAGRPGSDSTGAGLPRRQGVSRNGASAAPGRRPRSASTRAEMEFSEEV